ncbi:response regulator [Candidatus Aerophobetes bacterium]|nr:response regulator [Candidatus Aerophobetes bacterium]
MDSKVILLIEDDADISILVKIALEAAGYKVINVFWGKEGIEKAKKNKVNLILLDTMMSDIDGYEVIKNLKLRKTTKDIPVVFLSAKTQEKDIKKALSLGAVGYLTKPFDPEKLPKQIEKFIQN